MSATATGPDRPPLPVLTHVALPVLLTCIVLAIYPPAPARVATVLLLGAVYLYDASVYSGEDAGSAYWMGSALGPSWCGFVDMFLLARPVREWRFRTLDRPLGELPLLRRTYYVFCASQAARGVGWSYQVSLSMPLLFSWLTGEYADRPRPGHPAPHAHPIRLEQSQAHRVACLPCGRRRDVHDAEPAVQGPLAFAQVADPAARDAERAHVQYDPFVLRDVHHVRRVWDRECHAADIGTPGVACGVWKVARSVHCAAILGVSNLCDT